MDRSRMERQKRGRIHKIMACRPDPNHQKFWVNNDNGFDEFLLKRFDEHYADFLNKVEMEMLKND